MYAVRSHITGGRVCYGHRRVYVVRSHITGGTICYGRRRVYVVRSYITGGTICYRHRLVCLMRSHITGGTVWHGLRRVYVVRSHITGGTICYWHRHALQSTEGSASRRSTHRGQGLELLSIFTIAGAIIGGERVQACSDRLGCYWPRARGQGFLCPAVEHCCDFAKNFRRMAMLCRRSTSRTWKCSGTFTRSGKKGLQIVLSARALQPQPSGGPCNFASGEAFSFARMCVGCEITHQSHTRAGTICYWHRRVYVVRSHITGSTI